MEKKQSVSSPVRYAVLLVVGIAIFTDMFVYGLIVPILPKTALRLAASPAALGFLFASYALALLVAPCDDRSCHAWTNRDCICLAYSGIQSCCPFDRNTCLPNGPLVAHHWRNRHHDRCSPWFISGQRITLEYGIACPPWHRRGKCSCTYSASIVGRD